MFGSEICKLDMLALEIAQDILQIAQIDKLSQRGKQIINNCVT